MDDLAAWAGSLEIRQIGGARVIAGTFPFNTLAVINDRSGVRKETISPGAFSFAINDSTRPIDMLVGHSWNRPIASRKAGTLAIREDADAVRFEATLPPEHLTPSWVLDAEKAIANGTMTGISPGFRVPPSSVVRGAEVLEAEVGNPGVSIRRINAAVLREMSLTTSGAYVEAFAELRAEDFEDFNGVILIPIPRIETLWL